MNFILLSFLLNVFFPGSGDGGETEIGFVGDFFLFRFSSGKVFATSMLLVQGDSFESVTYAVAFVQRV